jgi:adenylylsulfate kinase-like enzyme
MSGSGKSTLATYIEDFCKKRQYKVYIVDGDEVRDKDVEKLGFDREDVLKNNLRIAKLCLSLKDEGFNIVLVPVISPYEEIRGKVRLILEPNLHLVYVKADIDSLKKRDTKGLYAASDNGLINDLIGYSEVNPYDEPSNAELTIETGNHKSVQESCRQLSNYFTKEIIT